MRDLIVSLIIIGLFPVCFRRPYVGLVVFSWLAYMRIQDLTWGFARGFRWSFYVAIITVVGWIRQPDRGPFMTPDVRTYMMVAIIVLVGLGVVTANQPNSFALSYQIKRYVEFVKIVGIALFTTGLVVNREQLRLLIWIVALSLGFYGVKNGIWGITTLGRVPITRGPGGLMFDNNDFSLALAMGVPMLWCIGQSDKRPILRRAFLFTVPMTAFTVLLTHSRGGMLSMSAAIGVLVWRSRHRSLAIVLGILSLPLVVAVMPEDMRDRFASIANYQEDGSANARFRTWGIAYKMAISNPVLGVGLYKFRQEYLYYVDDPTQAEREGKTFVAHNSYLQIWAECGSLVFGLYLSMIAISIASIWRVRALARRRFHESWIINYANMFEASFAAFCVGATFLNRAHFDLFYHWVAIALVFARIATKELEEGSGLPAKDEGFGQRLKAIQGRGFSSLGSATSGARAPQRVFRNTLTSAPREF